MAETFPPYDELKLRVLFEVQGGKTRLQYVLNSGAAGFTDLALPGPVLIGSPEEFCVDLLRRMEDLGAGHGVGGELLLRADIEKKLANLGRELYQDLFPPQMQRAYRGFRKSVRSLSIISDEPWIPWEMIKAYDDSETEIIDDDFLCIQFQVTRWLSGNTAAPTEIPLSRLACITVPSSLPSATAERDRVRSLAKTHPEIQDASPEFPTWDAVNKILEGGGINLFHFVGHGDFDRARPNQSAIPLADGRSLLPEDLQGSVRTQLRRDRPFVFFNACRVGQQSWALTGLGGWARRWIRDCGCSGFIGPHWAVKDSAALEFSTAFYDAIERGETLGQASHSARLAVRAKRPDDPTWLAFAVYANACGSFEFPSKALKPTLEIRGQDAVQSVPTPYTRLQRPTLFEQYFSAPGEIVASPPPEIKGSLTTDNLRIKQNFTDYEKDRFIEDSFAYIVGFFERSLTELKKRYPKIEIAFQRIDQQHFTAAVYRDGKKESCLIWIDKGFMAGIAYADGDSRNYSTYSESLSVADDGYSLFLRPLGLRMLGSSDRKPLAAHEAAEFLWSMLIQRLQ